MLSGPFLSKDWLGAIDSFENANIVMVGLPYDGTCSFRPGSRFAPQEIRLVSDGLENYSPVFDKELEEVGFYDAGDLELPFGNREKSLQIIETAAKETFEANKKWLGIGGEHLVTYPAVKACREEHQNLSIIHFDAHADLRDDYLGEKLSHATVIRRCVDLVGANNLVQTGIRSGPKEEYNWMKKNKTLFSSEETFSNRVKQLGDKPVYLTIDLDVLDPSIFSGTGTPEPGGMTFSELVKRLMMLKGLNIVGADVVELAPHYDTSGVSTITAAKIIREVLFLL